MVEVNNQNFVPFYELIANLIPRYTVGRVLVSGLLGLAFLTPHYLIVGSQVFGREGFDDSSWFLGVLISTAMLCLYYATHTLRSMFPEMDILLRPVGSESYMRTLTKTISDSKVLIVSLFFGCLKLAFCYAL